MSSTIKGTVFDDPVGSGIYKDSYTKIEGVYIYIVMPDGSYTNLLTDGTGYSIEVNEPGDYEIYETARIIIDITDLKSRHYLQPNGYNVSTSRRYIKINITSEEISSGKIVLINFGHANYAEQPVENKNFYISANGGNSSLSTINDFTKEESIVIMDSGRILNALGYNQVDKLLYAIDTVTKELVRIDGNYNIHVLMKLDQLQDETINSGGLDKYGNFYFYDWGTNHYYILSLKNNYRNFLYFIDSTDGDNISIQPIKTKLKPSIGEVAKMINVGDWIHDYRFGKLYGVDYGTNSICSIDSYTGEFSVYNTIGLPSPQEIFGSAYFGIISGNTRGIFVGSNQTGNFYEIILNDVTKTATATWSFKIRGAGLGDATSTSY